MSYCKPLSIVYAVSAVSSMCMHRVAMATFLEGLCGITSVTGVQKALRCQKAEHTFADTPCGIMDQYISALGQEGNLLLIDCRSNEASLVPFGGGGSGSGESTESPVVLVTNSNVKHTLSGSEYPDRVRQCLEAVAIFQTKYPQVKALRDATPDMLEAVKHSMSEVVYRRARHCILEDKRTLDAVSALKGGDFETVGRLMTESHTSLQYEYEVSCPELDLLVQIANQVPGVYGSRMTGGGFGGCTVTLVARSSVAHLKHELEENYHKQMNLRCVCYEAKPSKGAGMLDLEAALKEADNENAWGYDSYDIRRPIPISIKPTIYILT
jgi:galactokinase